MAKLVVFMVIIAITLMMSGPQGSNSISMESIVKNVDKVNKLKDARPSEVRLPCRNVLIVTYLCNRN